MNINTLQKKLVKKASMQKVAGPVSKGLKYILRRGFMGHNKPKTQKTIPTYRDFIQPLPIRLSKFFRNEAPWIGTTVGIIQAGRANASKDTDSGATPKDNIVQHLLSPGPKLNMPIDHIRNIFSPMISPKYIEIGRREGNEAEKETFMAEP